MLIVLPDITLVTPRASQPPLEAALSQNPHLTSLPSPSPSVLAPAELSHTTGTSELLRLPEVQACIKSDFVLLPCDLVCDLPGESLLEAWMITQGGLDGSSVGENFSNLAPKIEGVGGEKGGRRGGIGVWYQIASKQGAMKGDVADFLAIAPLHLDETPLVNGPLGAPLPVRAGLSRLVYATPMDTLKDIMQEKKALLIRHSLLKRHGRVKMLTTYRDAHIYLFPYWVKEMARRNEKFESVSEDLVGWWAKAEWQIGLAEKLGLTEVFQPKEDRGIENGSHDGEAIEEEIDLKAMSTTRSGGDSDIYPDGGLTRGRHGHRFSAYANTFQDDIESPLDEKLVIPPILAYIHSSQPSAPLICRVDNTALLLTISLRLAKLDSINDVGRDASSPFAHAQKIAYPAGIAQRCTVTKADCLLADNVTVEEKSVIKESVIGANCHIASGARLTRCLLMDGVIIGERCQLTGCVVGRRSKIGRESVLKDCEVQDGNVVPDETEAKNEKFMIFEGLDDDIDDIDIGGDDDSNGDLNTGT
jgi:translation initiation factor eIF-2B subunit gamma